MEEIWKDIKGYEGLYQVSNLGKIKTVKGNKTRKLQYDNQGYAHILLCKNNTPKRYKVHRLVAEAFIQNPNNYPFVNHKDEIKSNNNVDNLEWCNAKYNANYGMTQIKRINTFKKQKTKPFTKRKVIQYDYEQNFIKEWQSINEASRKLGITKQSISECCRKLRKTTGGYIWEYKL